jgi:purine catabolism regulator
MKDIGDKMTEVSDDVSRPPGAFRQLADAQSQVAAVATRRPGSSSGSSGTGQFKLFSTGTFVRGLPLRDVLQAPTLLDARLLAGAQGLDRLVQRLNVMELPDILPWVKPDELWLTTGYPLLHAPDGLPDLVHELNSRHLAGLAIKIGPYVNEIPAEMLAEADRLGFPIIQLPADLSFDDVINQVLTGILNRQAALLARSEEVHRALLQIVLGGGGLQELAWEVSQQLEAGITVREAASASGITSVPRQSEPSRLEPGLEGANVLAVDIVAGGTVHGSIEARRFGAEFVEEDRHILERAATVAALVVTRELAVNAVESKYQADFLRDVMDGRAGDARHLLSRAKMVGWDLTRPLVVVVARFDDLSALDELEQRSLQDRLNVLWCRAATEQDPTGATAGFMRHAVAFLGDEPGRTALKAARGAHDAFKRSMQGIKRPWTVGVSRVVHQVEDLPVAHMQAMRAAFVGAQVHGHGSITEFDELGIFRLLSLIPDAAELHAFVSETLGDLAQATPDCVELRETLAVLLEANMNAAEAARRLHFHYNTMRYRIDKLERLLGPFMHDDHRRLDISLALRILEMKPLR